MEAPLSMEVLLRSEDGDLAGKTGKDGKGPSLATNVLRRFKEYFFDQAHERKRVLKRPMDCCPWTTRAPSPSSLSPD